MNWQPIDTAPKDGTYILLAGPSGYTGTPLRVAVGRWEDFCWSRNGGWRNHAHDWFTDSGADATHWMPLPAQPQQSLPELKRLDTPLLRVCAEHQQDAD